MTDLETIPPFANLSEPIETNVVPDEFFLAFDVTAYTFTALAGAAVLAVVVLFMFCLPACDKQRNNHRAEASESLSPRQFHKLQLQSSAIAFLLCMLIVFAAMASYGYVMLHNERYNTKGYFTIQSTYIQSARRGRAVVEYTFCNNTCQQDVLACDTKTRSTSSKVSPNYTALTERCLKKLEEEQEVLVGFAECPCNNQTDAILEDQYDKALQLPLNCKLAALGFLILAFILPGCLYCSFGIGAVVYCPSIRPDPTLDDDDEWCSCCCFGDPDRPRRSRGFRSRTQMIEYHFAIKAYRDGDPDSLESLIAVQAAMTRAGPPPDEDLVPQWHESLQLIGRTIEEKRQRQREQAGGVDDPKSGEVCSVEETETEEVLSPTSRPVPSEGLDSVEMDLGDTITPWSRPIPSEGLGTSITPTRK